MIDTCACGDAVTKGGTRCGRCDALHALGLEYGARDDEIKDAYRILAKVWHPDRFQSDKKLKTTAEEKLKEFNSAFQLLSMPSSRRVSPNPSQGRSPSRPKPPEPQTEQSQPRPHIRLFKLAGRPTKEQFILVYGERGPKMTWDQRAAAGVSAAKFQAALAAKQLGR